MVQSEGVVGAQLLHDQHIQYSQCLSRGGKSHVSSTRPPGIAQTSALES
jgi:hypothetical protein